MMRKKRTLSRVFLLADDNMINLSGPLGFLIRKSHEEYLITTKPGFVHTLLHLHCSKLQWSYFCADYCIYMVLHARECKEMNLRCSVLR